MTCNAVEIHNLHFAYPESSYPLFNGLYLSIRQGERFGLFGPNGAGKTTLISLITGVLKAQAGEIKIMGTPIETSNAKKHFGFVPQELAFYPELTPLENLRFFGAWANMHPDEIHTRSLEVLNILGLLAYKDKPVRQFSGGMKRRLNLAIGVIHNPAIIFLDEPTTGVDVQTRHAILRYLLDLNSRGTTLVYTSHLLKEAEELCEEIALMDQGTILTQGKLTELVTEHAEHGLESLFLKLTGKAYRDGYV
ncbi:MAG: ABC transporter ATP-binding protein [Chitinophagales bacterium]|nr:MAG: ABC transporter ATP-binding protein [Chitinophagales bacterium]